MIKKLFLKTRLQTEEICAPLAIEDYSVQPMVDASPPKWHLAHTTWFFEQFVLLKFDSDYQEFDPDFAFLFNSYYNNLGDRVLRPNRGLMTRPLVDKVYAYRNYVTKAVSELLDKNESDALREVITLGINHEQQHQELLAYDIKSLFGNQPTFPVYGDRFELPKIEEESKFITINEGLYTIGHTGAGFCFDCESESHQVFLETFQIVSQLVSNAQWLEFINAGGYQDFNLWHAEGWDFINNHNIKAPLYWFKKGDVWHRYTLGGFKPVDPQQAVMHISFYEAFAFAQWSGMRIPTEFEWEVASTHLDWGSLWEWTSSAFLPYPRFKKAKGAVGEYNGKFMINQKVLRGASVATPENHSRVTYRNFFHPHLRWHFAGLRLVK